jgi:RND family efflux transporter MFP subunit
MNQVTIEPKAREEVKRTQHDPKSAWGLGVGAVLVLGAVIAWGTWSHIARSSDAETALKTRQSSVPLVRVMPVKPIDGPSTVDLPGTMQAFDAAVLFARATGYIATRNVDIGSHVHAGDVLVVIAAPDLDQQLAQARAQLAQMQAALAQAQANGTLAKVTNQRTAQLVTQGWSTQQQGDTDRLTLTARIASIGSAQANLLAQQAQVNRLVELTGFERVTAPFDGVITARQVDVGSLVTADANGGTSLFSIARTDVLRVQVFVPQENVFGLKDGQPATVTVPQLPGRVFHGTVARNAQALATNTRTLLAEVDVDNKDAALAAGLYGIVHFEFPRDRPVVMIPSEAIMFDKNGLSAAVFDNGEIHLRHLDLQADNGAQVEVRAGLQPGDQVILNPPLNVTEGMKARTS